MILYVQGAVVLYNIMYLSVHMNCRHSHSHWDVQLQLQANTIHQGLTHISKWREQMQNDSQWEPACTRTATHCTHILKLEKVPPLPSQNKGPELHYCTKLRTQMTPTSLILDSEVSPSRGWAATSDSARLGQPLREVEQAPGLLSWFKNWCNIKQALPAYQILHW